MTWVIGPNGNGEIVEAVQDLIASIVLVIDHLAECQLLVDSVLDQSRASDDFPAL